MRAALYIRLSKEDDKDGPSESVSNQRALLLKYAEENELTVHDIYIDDGWSGCNFDRPAFLRLIEDIEAGKINMVITKDLSRLGRDYILTGHYLERYFPEHRVRYVSLLDGIDTASNTAANDITPFRAILNDMYARDISRKITSVKRDQQRRGLFIGGKPVYGYRKHPTEKNRIVIDETAAPTVRRIFEMALSGASCRAIASRLNRDGVIPPAAYAGLPSANNGPYAGLWSSERISEMLQNETYIGNMVQGRRIKSSYKSKKCLRQHPDNWVIVKNTHEPLVSQAEFDTIQKLLTGRRKTRSRTYDPPLKGLVFCHECGYPLGILNRRNAKNEDTLYFICRTHQRFTSESVCTAHCIKVQTVSDLIAQAVRDVYTPCLLETEILSTVENMILDFTDRQTACASPEQIQSKINALNSKLDRVYLDHLDGLITREDFRRIQLRLQQERDATVKQLEEREEAMHQTAPPVASKGQLVEKFLGIMGSDRMILRSLIQRIELTDTKDIIITFPCHSPGSSEQSV